MAYTVQTTVGELLRDKIAVEVLEKYATGISRNPMLGFIKGMTLEQLLGFPQAAQYGITHEMVEKVLAEIENRKKGNN